MTTRGHDPLAPIASAYAGLVENLASLTTGRTRRGPGGAVLAVTGAPVASLNGIVAPGLEPDPDEIAALAASEPWDVPWGVHVRGVPGPGVTEVAAWHGLTLFHRTPLMVRHPEQGMPEEPATGSLKVRAIGGNEFDVYVATMAEGFEVPPEVFRVFADPALDRMTGATFFLAEADGVPVGTGMAIVTGELTGIFNISTLPAHRRRGHGTAITTEMVRTGWAAGATTAYLYASEMGQPVYAAAGFRTEEYLTTISAPSPA
ncbi:GNAT family N-acetyltransferase [Streptomyces sp. NPDC046977]|uniref:GNAT family N-acetyltransferase n=1 Tax=Streptomyces sp. NPDC046977 TaxID=3154703 RepID=UPI003407173E